MSNFIDQIRAISKENYYILFINRLRQYKHIPIAVVPKYFFTELLAIVSFYKNHNRKCGQTARWSVPSNMEKQLCLCRD